MPMRVCMCALFMHTYMYACISMCSVCIHICVCSYMCVFCVYIYVCACMCMCCTCIHIWLVCMNVYMVCIYTYVCLVYVFVYMHICMYLYCGTNLSHENHIEYHKIMFLIQSHESYIFALIHMSFIYTNTKQTSKILFL